MKKAGSAEAEKSVVGTILDDNKVCSEIFDILTEDDFFVDFNKKLFNAMSQMYRRGEGIDAITLDEQLNKMDINTQAMQDYVLDLSGDYHSSVFIKDHIAIIKEASAHNQISVAIGEIIKEGKNPEISSNDLITFAESKIFNLSKNVYQQGLQHIRKGVSETLEYVEAKSKGVAQGLLTGLKDFDKFTGGLQAPDLIILGARPKMGKTALAFTIASNVGKTAPVAFFSMEMGSRQLVTRLMGAEAGINTQELNNGNFKNLDLLKKPAESLNRRKIYIDDSPSKKPIEVLSQCTRMKASVGLSLIVIDYLQLMEGNERIKGQSREQEIAGISRFLKKIAKDLNVPILALAQLSRGLEQREDKRPVASDLRESGAIEQDADMITFLYRDEVYNENAEKNRTEWIIREYRNGAQGLVELTFVPQFTQFVNYTPGVRDPWDSVAGSTPQRAAYPGKKYGGNGR